MTAKITSVSGTPERPIEHPFEYGDTFVRETLSDGSVRLKVGVRSGHVGTLRALAAALEPPYRLLYILHTSPSGSPLGRYESPDLDGPEVESFIHRFGSFVAEDARHDVWVHSESGATVVIDRYNMIYAYGPLDRFQEVLTKSGVLEVAGWAAPSVPYPHALHYHPEWNAAERTLLSDLEWVRKPLRDVDVQHWTGPQAS